MMKQKRILIIDDEPDIRELLEITLMRMDLDTYTAATAGEARSLIESQQFDLCLTDMKLPDGNGMELIEFIQKHCPQLPVAMITAFGSVDIAIDALKTGAFDFITKPIDLDRIRSLVENALNLDQSSSNEVPTKGSLLGESESIKRLRAQTVKLARSQAPVFISGESGSGKEVVARLIHSSGPRSNSPFVAVNCGAIPSELMESEFFGHLKGAFTGAYGDKQGLFEAANGGTLFLDEVADLPMPMQVKLLRAIQEKAIRKVGSTQEIKTDVRILSATHKDLTKQVAEGYFRSDLFYRINVIHVEVPSLRERPDDIEQLSNTILQRIADDWGLEQPKLSTEALAQLQGYSFPGNVRELENILERALTMAESNTIEAADLSLSGSIADSGEGHTDINPDEAEGRLDEYLAEIEREVLSHALEKTQGNRTAAAKYLGISFRQIRYRLQKLGME